MDKNRQNPDTALFGLLNRDYDSVANKWRFKPNWGPVFLTLAAVLALIWFGTATAVFCAFKYIRKYESISYWRVVQFPFDMSKFRTEMGEFQIDEANRFFQKGELAQGYMSLQNGVARAPDNLKGREMLAQFTFIFLRDTDRAAKYLDLKIAKAFETKDKQYLKCAVRFYAFSEEYRHKSASLAAACERDGLLSTAELADAIKNTIELFNRQRDYEAISQYCSDVLNAVKAVELKQTAARNGAIADTMRGYPERALKMLDGVGIFRGETRAIVESCAKWKKGDEIGALKVLKRSLTAKGKKKTLYEILADFQLDFGDFKRAKESRRLSMLASQDIAEPLLCEIAEADGKNAVSLAKKFVERFPNEVMRLSFVAVKTDNPDILDICFDAEKHPDRIYALNLSKSELYIRRNNPKDALTSLDAARYSEYGKTKANSISIDGFIITIGAMSGENVDGAIEKFSENSKSQSDISNLAKMLISAKMLGCADKVARAGLKKYPDSVSIYKRIVTIAEQNNDTAEIVRLSDIPDARIPIRILEGLAEKLSSDRFVFISHDKAEKARKASHAAKEKIAAYKNIFGNF